MGVVYLAQDTSLAALDHPNIVTIHTVEEEVGLRFLTMQLVEGQRLSDLIPRGGAPVERILEIAIPLVDALSAAHEKGVVHRDLKPGNLLVTDEDRVKVLDFGLAKLRPEEVPEDLTELPTEPLTAEGRILGTMPYMSPEQLEGKATVDARSDIFSLGIILYELATGERPLKGRTSASLLSSIMNDNPEPVDTARDDLPHHLGRVVRRCLEKEPDRRYQRAKDLLHELEDLRRERVTEAMIASLARIGDLKVISSRSGMQFKGVEKTLPQIARELGVDGLIEGSVLRSGGEVRITAQLIDARTTEILWVETFDRALEYFDRALEKDPTFAPALAEKATTFIGAAAYGATPPQLLYPESEKAAQEALELDETLAQAHTALGWVRLWSDWDWPASSTLCHY